MNSYLLRTIAFLSLGFWMTAAAFASEQSIKIVTGGKTGVYYAAGQSMCKLFKQSEQAGEIPCVAPESNGSVANIKAVLGGTAQFGLTQSDWQFHAVNATAAFKDMNSEQLRSVFSLHSEAFTVVARIDSGIAELDHLKGKRVNVGNTGSGHRSTMDVLLKAKGWSLSDFSSVQQLNSDAQADALIKGFVDAIVFVVGHPNASVHKATSKSNSRIIPISSADIELITATYPYYAATEIPARLYRRIDKPVQTFGLLATVVTSAAVPEEMVYQMTKSVLANVEKLRKLHPALRQLDRRRMVSKGNSAPLHPGARRYFLEAGLL